MSRYSLPWMIILSLILSACSPGAVSTPSQVHESSATLAPIDTRALPTSSPIPESTSTEVLLPSPTRGPTPTLWRPVVSKEKCTPSETRFCKVLIVLPAKYYAEQARFTFKAFEYAGFTVTKASKAPEVVEVCSTGVGIEAPEKTVKVDLALSEVKVAEYDAIVYIGGWGCQEQWYDEESHQIVREAVAQGKVLGAIGCAPTILAHAGVMVGKRSAICDQDAMVKGGKNYCKILESLGAVCGIYSIERDGLIVTAKQKARNFVDGVIEVIMENTAQ